MPGQFDKETSIQNFEWHRSRVLKEKRKGVSAVSANRVDFNLCAVAKKHGEKAAKELSRELRSK